MQRDRWVSDVEAATVLGCSAALLRLWRRQGKGPRFARVGRLCRYSVNDLEKWLEAQMVEPSHEVQP